MTQNCYSMRPGTIFGFKDKTWKVISNNTLNRTFEAVPVQGLKLKKQFRYPDSNEISIRWKPTNN